MNNIRKYVLLTVLCVVVPAVLVWLVLPQLLANYPTTYKIICRLTAIYLTIVTARMAIGFANGVKNAKGRSMSHQQYVNSFVGVLRIVIIFIAVILCISILFDKDPSTLLAGLGAASAILMLAFQDTIKGLVAGIRLTSNNMVAIGDRITVPSAGADGIVEDIALTTVKVRNFDNTIVTVTPQTLVDGSFVNWKGMRERVGRKAVRRVYIDYRSIVMQDDGVVNLTAFRNHLEEYIAHHPAVVPDSFVMVHQLDGTPTGLPIELVFWLQSQEVLDFEHGIADIMEHAYAAAPQFGLQIYQQHASSNLQ